MGVEGVHTCVCSRVHVLYSTINYCARDIHVTSYGTGARYLKLPGVCIHTRYNTAVPKNKKKKKKKKSSREYRYIKRSSSS